MVENDNAMSATRRAQWRLEEVRVKMKTKMTVFNRSLIQGVLNWLLIIENWHDKIGLNREDRRGKVGLNRED